jgi:hypothetical protein
MTPARRRLSRRKTVGAAMGVALLAAACLVWFTALRPDPQPRFADGSGVRIAENGPLPPAPVANSDVHVQLESVTGTSAEVMLFTQEGTGDVRATLAIGDTASLCDVTIRLCATWVNERLRPPWDERDGTSDYADRMYYVFAVEGSAPACPDPVN